MHVGFCVLFVALHRQSSHNHRSPAGGQTSPLWSLPGHLHTHTQALSLLFLLFLTLSLLSLNALSLSVSLSPCPKWPQHHYLSLSGQLQYVTQLGHDKKTGQMNSVALRANSVVQQPTTISCILQTCLARWLQHNFPFCFRERETIVPPQSVWDVFFFHRLRSDQRVSPLRCHHKQFIVLVCHCNICLHASHCTHMFKGLRGHKWHLGQK